MIASYFNLSKIAELCYENMKSEWIGFLGFAHIKYILRAPVSYWDEYKKTLTLNDAGYLGS